MTDSAALNDALSGNYLLVDIEIHSWSGKKTDRGASLEVTQSKGADQEAGRFVKYLFAGADDELKAVLQFAAAIRTFTYSRTLPWSGAQDSARRGARLLPATNAMEFLRDLSDIKRSYDTSVSQLAQVWDQRILDARSKLGQLADDADYPTAADIPSKFSVSVDLQPVPSVSDFSRINVPSALAEALGQRHASTLAAHADNAMDDLKTRLLVQLGRMATVLGKAAAGEKTRMHDSLVTNLQDLVTLARGMNLHSNPLLIELVDKIEEKLLKYSTEVYRKSPAAVESVAVAARELAVEAAIEDIWK